MHVPAAVPEFTLSDGWCCRGVDRLGGNWPRQDNSEHKSFHGAGLWDRVTLLIARLRRCKPTARPDHVHRRPRAFRWAWGRREATVVQDHFVGSKSNAVKPFSLRTSSSTWIAECSMMVATLSPSMASRVPSGWRCAARSRWCRVSCSDRRRPCPWCSPAPPAATRPRYHSANP